MKHAFAWIWILIGFLLPICSSFALPVQNHARSETTALELGINSTYVLSPRRRYYNWKEFQPRESGLLRKLRWLVSGDTTFAKQTDEQMASNFASLARMLILLREYKEKYGMPEFGGPQVQRNVIADITKELYQSGGPVWVLEPVLERVAEGLNGKTGVQFSILPRQAFIFYPSSERTPAGTVMLKLQPGFYMNRLGRVEQVAVRLASFASNTKSVERLSSSAFRMPQKEELLRVEQNETVSVSTDLQNENPTAEELAKAILDLASETYGLFFYLNSPKFQKAAKSAPDEFWVVEDSTSQVFTRLAANEASQSLSKIQRDEKELYSPLTVSLFRIFSSAGASAMWFGGSPCDMLVAGLLAIVVGYIGRSQALAFEERVLTEVVASFVVGLTAGYLSLKWPNRFCFGAIAVAATLDILQGFKVVYAVIEVMSKNVVAGTSRMLEGLLFTGLIANNLRFGLATAWRLFSGLDLPKDVSVFLLSTHGIRKVWYLLLLPLASIGWSGLFRPSYVDLPLMMFHGMLAFTLNMFGVPSFAAAMCVTFSAGMLSRFTGREALGNTVAGLYALVPGAYMVRGMLASTTSGFLESVVSESAAIGLGAWTGTMLCSPLILGKSSGLHGWSFGRKKKPQALLFF